MNVAVRLHVSEHEGRSSFLPVARFGRADRLRSLARRAGCGARAGNHVSDSCLQKFQPVWVSAVGGWQHHIDSYAVRGTFFGVLILTGDPIWGSILGGPG